ncbi:MULTISPECIES: YndM family protein [Cytobacillus]|uniref:YndM family protein n=1 Tax=Cytobacillus TaxID=2675230 RepID=UPI00203C8F09|nr:MULTISPECIES: YndM family protein [Cytobacillus]MCM3395131.1 YndM family protein [Cytobacillus oceanisediminis]UQX55740.1 YndM family protein [Cytobacillus pseudoceanisediminis]USK46705.1 YndM family protein [Cytobacillus oceanisediminis]
MQHFKALALKFLASVVLLYIILGIFFGMSFVNVFIITAILGITAYILGDMVILPRSSNMIATAADFGLAFLLIWFLSSILTNGDNLIAMSIAAALGVALFEYLFHLYLLRNMTEASNEKGTINQGNLRYNTEVSEDLTPVRPDVRSEEDK